MARTHSGERSGSRGDCFNLELECGFSDRSQMMKPVLLIACLVSLSGGIFAAEEKKDVQAVEQFRNFPGKNVTAEVWRLTVNPPKGSYVIAKV